MQNPLVFFLDVTKSANCSDFPAHATALTVCMLKPDSDIPWDCHICGSGVVDLGQCSHRLPHMEFLIPGYGMFQYKRVFFTSMTIPGSVKPKILGSFGLFGLGFSRALSPSWKNHSASRIGGGLGVHIAPT